MRSADTEHFGAEVYVGRPQSHGNAGEALPLALADNIAGNKAAAQGGQMLSY
jgi:hypothetical protein